MVVAAERDEAARKEWRDEISAIESEKLVFVDETGATIALTRRYARAPKGQRAHGSVPRNYGTSTTLVGSLSLEWLGAVMTVEGAVDGLTFTEYVRQLLCPTLRPGQVVVMDNLSAHKADDARLLIEAAGCSLLFLPAYSPDFSPIELTFSKIKEGLRARSARTQEALDRAIAETIDTVTDSDARGWFIHCGYSPASSN